MGFPGFVIYLNFFIIVLFQLKVYYIIVCMSVKVKASIIKINIFIYVCMGRVIFMLKGK
jgi:hypothetical protein